jgi:hypothetical protein
MDISYVDDGTMDMLYTLKVIYQSSSYNIAARRRGLVD